MKLNDNVFMVYFASLSLSQFTWRRVLKWIRN